MSFVLGPNSRAAGYRLFAYDAIGSTSAEALAMARAGDTGRVWVAAREQTAGVGRRGRAWQTPRGNLAASVFVVAETSASRAATLGFAAGLALMDALRSLAPALVVNTALDGASGRSSRVALKWPNDLVADGSAKVAGILLQAERLGENRTGVVAGIGVNVGEAAVGTPQPSTSLAALGASVTPDAVFEELTDSWLHYERLWNNGDGLPEIRAEWTQRATGIGGEIAVRADGEVIRGRFETIDDDGCLVIREDGGRVRRVSAGEVHLGTVASFGTVA